MSPSDFHMGDSNERCLEWEEKQEGKHARTIRIEIDWTRVSWNIGQIHQDDYSRELYFKLREEGEKVIEKGYEPRYYLCTDTSRDNDANVFRVSTFNPVDCVRLLGGYVAHISLKCWFEIELRPNPYLGKTRQQLAEILFNNGGIREKIPNPSLFEAAWKVAPMGDKP